MTSQHVLLYLRGKTDSLNLEAPMVNTKYHDSVPIANLGYDEEHRFLLLDYKYSSWSQLLKNKLSLPKSGVSPHQGKERHTQYV